MLSFETLSRGRVIEGMNALLPVNAAMINATTTLKEFIFVLRYFDLYRLKFVKIIN